MRQAMISHAMALAYHGNVRLCYGPGLESALAPPRKELAVRYPPAHLPKRSHGSLDRGQLSAG